MISVLSARCLHWQISFAYLMTSRWIVWQCMIFDVLYAAWYACMHMSMASTRSNTSASVFVSWLVLLCWWVFQTLRAFVYLSPSRVVGIWGFQAVFVPLLAVEACSHLCRHCASQYVAPHSFFVGYWLWYWMGDAMPPLSEDLSRYPLFRSDVFSYPC